MAVGRSCGIQEGFDVEGYDLKVVDEMEPASAVRA